MWKPSYAVQRESDAGCSLKIVVSTMLLPMKDVGCTCGARKRGIPIIVREYRNY